MTYEYFMTIIYFISSCIFTYLITMLYYTIRTIHTIHMKKSTLSHLDVLSLACLNLFIVFPHVIMIRFLLQIVPYYPTNYLQFTIQTILFIPCLMFSSLIFAIIHYYLHKIKIFYNKIHIIHHRAVITKPMDSLYVHPLEFIFSMIIPIMLSCYIFNMSLLYTLLITIISIHENVHSHLTLETETTQHNYHHKLFNVNYDSYPYLLSKYVWHSYKKNS